MTLFRIYSGSHGIDYWEHRKELGFVIADTQEQALEYARTLPLFAKPDNGYDADLIRQGRPPAATEGFVQVVEPFIMTPDNFTQLKEANQRKQELLEQKQEVEKHLSELNQKLKDIH